MRPAPLRAIAKRPFGRILLVRRLALFDLLEMLFDEYTSMRSEVKSFHDNFDSGTPHDRSQTIFPLFSKICGNRQRNRQIRLLYSSRENILSGQTHFPQVGVSKSRSVVGPSGRRKRHRCLKKSEQSRQAVRQERSSGTGLPFGRSKTGGTRNQRILAAPAERNLYTRRAVRAKARIAGQLLLRHTCL